ncbi:hypothetical protein GGQ74_001128 [Desulfobaculum xiamenense]|uniref:DUF4760 domain-containing protein n=1 Tax=Desulfobaculum xiamenense TaxID=995050 RepID=A0A846QGS6_9BACT|nr:hypothetical protein [Desulfobaculum xiamenense]NJB67488.1 hypothetical protein [Desulfobaculum xiamenense]
MSWKDFLTAFLAALLSGGLVYALQWRNEKKSLNKDKLYACMTLYLFFERFSIACSNMEHCNEDYLASFGAIGRLCLDLPSVDMFPININWQSLSKERAESVLTFKNDLMFVQHKIYVENEICGVPDSVELYSKECRRLGIIAFEIARLLRADCSIDDGDMCKLLKNIWSGNEI